MRAPTLAYQQRSVSVISSQTRGVPELDLRYDGRPVENLTKTLVVLWNRGAPIRGADTAGEDPLRFELPGNGTIVAARVLKTTSPSTKFALVVARNACAAIFDFELLGPGEGAVLEILHTATEPFGRIAGTIGGAPVNTENRGRLRAPFNPLPNQVPSGFKAIGSTTFIVTFAIGALLVLLSAFGSHLALALGPHVGPVMSVIEGISDVIYAIFALVLINEMRRRFPEPLAIPELVE